MALLEPQPPLSFQPHTRFCLLKCLWRGTRESSFQRGASGISRRFLYLAARRLGQIHVFTFTTLKTTGLPRPTTPAPSIPTNLSLQGKFSLPPILPRAG